MQILKTTGEHEEFSSEKLTRSLERAGASRTLAAQITAEIAKDKEAVQTTQRIHSSVFSKLKREYRPIAARYNLKRAVQKLGPSGYPFEKYVGSLFEALGYSVKTGQIVQGACVSHEVDVIVEKDNIRSFFECKFHNSLGLKSDIKVALYVKARFDDIKRRLDLQKEKHHKQYDMWVVTNTKFTTEAWHYGKCVGMTMMSWDYPHGASLAELIDRVGVHPVTVLTYLSNQQKDALIKDGLILCKDLQKKSDTLDKYAIYGQTHDLVLKEARAVCELREVL